MRKVSSAVIGPSLLPHSFPSFAMQLEFKNPSPAEILLVYLGKDEKGFTVNKGLLLICAEYEK
jgi:hypothetical protein